MVDSVPWKWQEVTDAFWNTPSEDAHYLAARWRESGKETLLDLGCGTGRHALFFAEHGFSVDAFDLSDIGTARVAGVARERELPIRTRVGDMTTLPYPSGSFGCVLAFHVVYHTDRAGIERTISEIHRVLAPGGEVFLSFNSRSNPSFLNPRNQHIDEFTVVKTEGQEAGIPHYFVDEAEVMRLLSVFELIRLTHVNEIMAARSSWHFFVLACKPE